MPCQCHERKIIRLSTGPHYAAEVCADCGRWFRWVPRPGAPARRPAAHGNLLARYGRGYCEMCLRSVDQLGPRGGLVAHHVRQYARGGGPQRENVWILCTSCHLAVHWLRERAMPADEG